jgi:alpha-L-rhamnosidase
MLQITQINCEQMIESLPIDKPNPRFSWILSSENPEVFQYSYRILVSDVKNPSFYHWDSGMIISNNTHLISYEGIPLSPCTIYKATLQVIDTFGTSSHASWQFETGLMLEEDRWSYPAISAAKDIDFSSSCGWYLMKKTFLMKPVRRISAYATALGMYEIYINDKRVGTQEFSPGWTNYEKRLQYQVYDVTDYFGNGSNMIRAHLGTGWYKGDLGGWLGLRGIYGKRNWFSMVLRVEYEDGSIETIVTDDSWKSCHSPVLFSEIYHGEIYDARKELSLAQLLEIFDSCDGVEVTSLDTLEVVPQQGPNVLPQEIIKPIGVLQDSNGKTILDFGQNMTGQMKLTVKGKSGASIQLLHGEILDEEGNLYVENLRSARQRIEYICKGANEETFKPHFTFQGFRYVLIQSLSGNFADCHFEAIVYHSQMERGGYFSCSDERVNRLFENIVWGMKGNFLDVPTDCPQRDERLGWTGDAQVFINTACRLRNTSEFFRKWLADMRSEQHEDGGLPHVVPDIFKATTKETLSTSSASASGWADAAVICPWELYLQYGDATFLAENFDMMKKWVSYIENHATNGLLWEEGFQFGDWLALDAEEGSYFGATPNDLTATAFYANSVTIMQKSAAVLGFLDEENYYRNLHTRIKEAFGQRYFTKKGMLTAQTQTAHVLALQFKLVPEPYVRNTVEALVNLIKKNDMHLSTGFLGTPYLCDVLTNNGRNDIAYTLLFQDTCPSWLYQVSKGATTIWEHWDGLKPDGSLWSADMNSFNHYAYGSIGTWFLGNVAGINTSEKQPGYKHILFTPHPEVGLQWAEASQMTPYGKVSIKWERTEKGMVFELNIPMHTTGSLQIPKTGEIIELKPGYNLRIS